MDSLKNYPYIVEMVEALKDEIKILQQQGESELKVLNGKLTKIESGEYIYSFVIEDTLIATDDQPIEILSQGNRFKAVLIGKEGNTVLVATNHNLGEVIAQAVLIISPVFLLKALISVLEQLPNIENYNFEFPNIVIGKKRLPKPGIQAIGEDINLNKINDFQVQAIKTSIGSNLTFIWGPPGTGKTTVIGKIVECLLKNNERVLITSHTNVAVDTALKDILENKGNNRYYAEGKILRYGVHQMPELERYPLIFGQNVAAKSSEDLVKKLTNLDVEESNLTKRNKYIENHLDSLRSAQVLTDKKQKLESESTFLLENIKNLKSSIQQLTERKNLTKRQLDKASQNSWLSNTIQGLNADKLLSSIVQIDKDNQLLNSQLSEQLQKLRSTEEEIKSLKQEIKNVQPDKEVLLQEVVSELELNLKQVDNIRTERRSIQEQIDQMSSLILNSARVVATTLTKCYLRGELLAQKFDVVIIDEISMAQIPHLFVAIGLGKKVILVGDFLQLPPIVQSKTEMAQKWLGQNIYDYFEIPNQFLNDNTWIDQLKPLFKQYRMHPDISYLINELVYKGRLEDDIEQKKDRETRSHLAPFNGHVAYLDTSTLAAYCRKKEGGSRYTFKNAILNLLIANITVEDYLNKNDIQNVEQVDIVGVVTPYRAQANLIAKFLSDITIRVKDEDVPLARFIEVNTVHRFQGNQRKVIIFDTTDDFPMFKPAPIVDDNESGGQDMKLINVAVTRSRDKFLLIGNKEFIESKHSETSLIKQVLPLIEEKGQSLSTVDLLSTKFSNNYYIHSFNDYKWVNDEIMLSNSAVQIIVSNLFTTDFFSHIKHSIDLLRNRGVMVEVFTQLPDNYPQEYVKLAESTLSELETKGVKCHLRAKFKEQLIIIDKEMLYYFLNEKDGWGIKIKSPKGIKELYKLFNLEVPDDVYPCPVCKNNGRNGKVVLKEGRFGAFYSCSLYPKCKYIDRDKGEGKDDIQSFELNHQCPNCGKALGKKKGRYGIFWGCTGYPKCKYILKD